VIVSFGNPEEKKKTKVGEFNCHSKILTSDHVPVSAQFNIPTLLPMTLLNGHNHYISILDVKGTNLLSADINGFSDPYIVFHGSFLTKDKMRTPIKYKTLNPDWQKAVFALICKCQTKKELKKRYILFRVMDWDQIGDDDPIGQGSLSLDIEFDKLTPFVVDLSQDGKSVGNISGSLYISENPKPPILEKRDSIIFEDSATDYVKENPEIKEPIVENKEQIKQKKKNLFSKLIGK